MLRVALSYVLLAVTLPAMAAAQSTSVDSLLNRIDLLERRTVELERRVKELEALIKAPASKGRTVTISPDATDLASWRRLRRGMRMDDVRAVLGEPGRVDAGSVRTYWYYPNGAHAYFDADSGRLDGWSEPAR